MSKIEELHGEHLVSLGLAYQASANEMESYAHSLPCRSDERKVAFAAVMDDRLRAIALYERARELLDDPNRRRA